MHGRAARRQRPRRHCRCAPTQTRRRRRRRNRRSFLRGVAVRGAGPAAVVVGTDALSACVCTCPAARHVRAARAVRRDGAVPCKSGGRPCCGVPNDLLITILANLFDSGCYLASLGEAPPRRGDSSPAASRQRPIAGEAEEQLRTPPRSGGARNTAGKQAGTGPRGRGWNTIYMGRRPQAGHVHRQVNTARH